MSKIIEDADKLINYVSSAIQAGAETAQGKTDPPPTIGIFTDSFPEWTADNGAEETGHISKYKGMAYQCINAIQRFEHYAPDIATNNYNPYPAPDAEGVIPICVWNGSKHWYEGKIQRNSIQGDTGHDKADKSTK